MSDKANLLDINSIGKERRFMCYFLAKSAVVM
jgi:hypothetical protein